MNVWVQPFISIALNLTMRSASILKDLSCVHALRDTQEEIQLTKHVKVFFSHVITSLLIYGLSSTYFNNQTLMNVRMPVAINAVMCASTPTDLTTVSVPLNLP